MFCQQCEQTATPAGCDKYGQCGKTPEVDAVQDLMVYSAMSLAPVVLKAKDLGINTRPLDLYICESLFATMTNVNFGKRIFIQQTRHIITQRELLKQQISEKLGTQIVWPPIANYTPNFGKSLVGQGKRAIEQKVIPQAEDEDIFSLKLTILYGLKGSASYMHLAHTLGMDDESIYRFYYEALETINSDRLTVEAGIKTALKLGEVNYKVMELLSTGHTSTYGHPVPTPVPLNVKQGKAILVSGHDIKVLAELLEQTADLDINIYTHGELLPAHGYPKLKQKYPHLYGHYGTGWVKQQEEFDDFPGSILMTTNCLMPPHDGYEDRLFTTSVVGHPELEHIPEIEGKRNFQLLINKALEMPGFIEDELPPRQVLTGFGHNAFLELAERAIDGVKSGQIRHFFLVGGCDGAKPGRSYYTEFVEKVPQDCLVLTLACGKFRFFDRSLGEINGIPRLLDMGQCNDAYSAIQVTLALAKAFQVGVNELPLSLIITWYEQKAIAVLLTLLYLGIQNIRLGPTLPSFLSPNVFNLLSQTYNLKPITTPDADLAACLVSK